MIDARAREPAPGAAWLAVGAAPLAYGALSNAAAAGGGGALPIPCGFRAVTGLPCPFCGATRSFRLATAGDLRFLDYNPWWVLVAVVLVVVGAGVLLAGLRGRRAAPVTRTKAERPGPTRWSRLGLPRPGMVIAVVVAVGWCVGLAHRDAIVG